MPSDAPTLAALAALPRRAALLPQVLQSLRPQVQRLCVYLNGYREVPACVRELADEHVLDHENAGAERKLMWADRHSGLYLSCDDDIVYPPDYVAVMTAAIAEHGPRVLVTGHGRIYLGTPRTVHQVLAGSVGLFHRRIDCGRAVNHGGTGVMAWDARAVRVPTSWAYRNILDMQLAIWAQRERVPMWLVPHQANWFKPLALTDPEALFAQSQNQSHGRRNQLLTAQSESNGWHLWS